jgi:hypothetical protein
MSLTSRVLTQLRQALEFLIIRIQSDLEWFGTAVERKDPHINKTELCEAIADVDRKTGASMLSEPNISEIAQQYLTERKKWCTTRAAESPAAK